MERGAMARIPRFSVSQITTIGRAFEADLAAFVAAGVPAVGVSIHKLERCGVARGLRLLRDSGLPVSCFTSAGPVPLDDEAAAATALARVREHLDAAAEAGAASLILLPGATRGLAWEEACARARPLVASLLAEAERLGVRIAIEPVSQLRMDLCFLHSFDEALDFIAPLGSPHVGVVLELNNAWIERGLAGNIRRRTADIALVQVSDFAIGTQRTSERVMIGDGGIPLRRWCSALAAAGYDGWWDIELLGPAIETIGYDAVVPLAMERFRELWA
jgi:sugar phosphate isomerase/epimerase